MSDFGSFAAAVELIGVMAVTGAAFASTNVDNLVLISAYDARPGYRPVFLKLTFILVCLTVLSVSLALARAADTLPAGMIRYLGLIPMAIGAHQAVKLLVGQISALKAADQGAGPEAAPNWNGIFAYLGVALVLLANSSDSVVVLAPLLADLKPAYVMADFVAALATAFVMSVLAHRLARHPASRIYLEKFAQWALPFLLIAIGLLIFTDEPAAILLSPAG